MIRRLTRRRQATQRNSFGFARPQSGIKTRFRPPLDAEEGRFEFDRPESSSLARGIAGFEAWVTEEATADAKRSIPGDDWVDVLPPLLREVERIGRAELEAVGKTWSLSDAKLSRDVLRGLYALDRRAVREKAFEDEAALLNSQLDEYFEQAKKTDTLDDDYRRFEGPFSVKTIGFWSLMVVLALGEFPLTAKASQRLDPGLLSWVSAFATGVGLVAAGHFVGTKARRLITIAERWHDYEERTIEATGRAELRTVWSLGLETVPPQVPDFPTRRPPKDLNQRSRWTAVVTVVVLAAVACFSLALLRTRHIQSERIKAFGTCESVLDDPDANASLRDECVVARQALEEVETTRQLVENVTLFTVVQLMLFGVAVATTYHRHDEFAEAVRTLRAKQTAVTWRARRAHRRRVVAEHRLAAVASKRQSEFTARILETTERRRVFEAAMLRVLTLANRERLGDPLFEIAALSLPTIPLPGWVFASYPLPGGKHSEYTLSGGTFFPGQLADTPIVSAPAQSSKPGPQAANTDPDPDPEPIPQPERIRDPKPNVDLTKQ
jgi:hypothetical protein